MIIRYLTSPIRMLLGLPPVYGIRLSGRVLQILRGVGLYHGPIHFRCKVKAIQVGATQNPIGMASKG